MKESDFIQSSSTQIDMIRILSVWTMTPPPVSILLIGNHREQYDLPVECLRKRYHDIRVRPQGSEINPLFSSVKCSTQTNEHIWDLGCVRDVSVHAETVI